MGRSAILLCALLACACLSGCGGSDSTASITEDPALTAKVESAIKASGGADGIDDVQAFADGKVFIWLLVTSEAVGGENRAGEILGAYGKTVVDAVPEVTAISGFDADNKLVFRWER